MVNIHIVRDKEGFIRQFIVKGHAGFDEEGKDIVCAAVSITAYNAVGALEDLAGIRRCYSERDGYMLCSIPDNISEEKKQIAKIILETTAIGFKQIQRKYKNYVSVMDEEV
ncbi:MAG: ribosomal-processing cysteine protease Prp [Clostridiales bacterium]|jgi:uncharacterized protein YsxB (DUF464 family)|nr:ribosomal-processing cysteine protease Prp [Eubacteriales bacterium]MDH7565897.1 ribosomal-processing cysteine protease Prp [Clostridiales bacterium]